MAEADKARRTELNAWCAVVDLGVLLRTATPCKPYRWYFFFVLGILEDF